MEAAGATGRFGLLARRILTPRPEYNPFTRAYWFGQVDARPLSAFRIVFSLLLLKDAIYSLWLARVFYSDDGIVPRSALPGIVREIRFSLLDHFADAWMVQVYLAAWIVVLLMMLVGYRTRLAIVVNAVMIVSLHERNIWVLNGADTVFRILSIWSVFMSLGQCWSVDAILGRLRRHRVSGRLEDLRAPVVPRTAWALPVRAAQLQVAIVYVFTGLLKVIEPGSDWVAGVALHRALQLRSHTLPPGDWLYEYGPDWVLRAINHGTIFAELAFIVLVFSPLFQPLCRIVGLGLGVMLHVGIALTMSIANFPQVMITSYLLFADGRWLAWFGRQLRSVPAVRPTLSVPPAGSPLWLLIGATGEAGIAVDRATHSEHAGADAWLIREPGGTTLSGAAAWTLATSALPLGHLWGRVFSFRRPRLLAWALLSRLSRQVGTPEAGTRQGPAAGRLGAWRPLARAFTAVFIVALSVMVVRWNLGSTKVGGKRLIGPVKRIEGRIILMSGLWQVWRMFAPSPAHRDGWVIVRGTFEDGRVLDLRTGAPPEDELPRVFFGPDGRWKKYEVNLLDTPHPQLLDAWVNHYCARHGRDGLATVEIVFRGFITGEPGAPPRPMEDWVLATRGCPEDAPTGR